MGRTFTLSLAVLLITGQTSVVLSKAVEPNAGRDPKPAAYAVADGFNGRRIFVPRRYLPATCSPNPDAPARRQLDPGLHYLGPCESAPARIG
jgi:hypothetical protein